MAALAAVAVLTAIFLRARFDARRSSDPAPRPTATVYPNRYDSVQPFMEGIYAADREVRDKQVRRIRGVIVPHHLVSSPAIASGIRMLLGQTFKRVLLLSPDHFHRCPTLLCTVDGEYRTWFGNVSASDETLDALRSSPYVTEDSDLFESEHGINAVIPFFAHYFPDVPVTPLALSQRISWRADRTALLEIIKRAVDDDTVIVVSSDFSHYLSLAEAEGMDELTSETIFFKDLDGIAKMNNPGQSDCPGCLWLLAALADARGFYHPSVVMHTNSALILNDKRIPETTSHFSMVWFVDAPND